MIQEDARRQEKLKNLKTSDRREERQLGKSEVKQEHSQEKNTRHEKFWNQHPAAEPGLSGVLGPPLKGGEEE